MGRPATMPFTPVDKLAVRTNIRMMLSAPLTTGRYAAATKATVSFIRLFAGPFILLAHRALDSRLPTDCAQARKSARSSAESRASGCRGR